MRMVAARNIVSFIPGDIVRIESSQRGGESTLQR